MFSSLSYRFEFSFVFYLNNNDKLRYNLDLKSKFEFLDEKFRIGLTTNYLYYKVSADLVLKYAISYKCRDNTVWNFCTISGY